MLLDGVAAKAILPKWGKPEGYFDIPDSLLRRFPVLRTSPVRAAPAASSGRVYQDSNSHGSVTGAYPYGLLLGCPAGATARRYWAWFAILLFAFFFILFADLLSATISRGVKYPSVVNSATSVLITIALTLIFLCAVWSVNIVFRSPPDWPIMFNRRTREVAYFEVKLPHFFRFWRPVQSSVVVRNWQDAQFRVYKTVHFTGAGLKQLFELALLWGDEEQPTTLKDFVLIGDKFISGDEPCLRIWEHIRRYMDESGPILERGEALREPPNNNPPLRFPKHLEEAAGGAPLSAEQIETMGLGQHG